MVAENKTTIDNSNKVPPSPLNPNEKIKLIKKLQKANDDQLSDVLLAAALNNCTFPEPIHDEIYYAQQTYQKFKQTGRKKAALKSKAALRAYFAEDGGL